ncbi:MAG: glycosyltransferase family 2 protein [Nanoarchaeota archaeon]|nr:glycosyltransferase family 2 protein [Nanoarchaeota archaeon]
MKRNPLVSVVIPAYNEEKDIGACITSLQKQSYKKIEIIIVDDGSKDRTREIVEGFKGVRLIEGKHKGPGFSRNLGAEKAKGEILVFVDSDMTFDKNYVKELIKPIVEEGALGTEDGFQIAANQDNIWSKCWGQYTRSYDENVKKYGNKKYIEGYIFRAISKKEFFKMGGFDPSYGYADDLTFYFKYGVSSLRVKKAFCYHKNPETLKAVYKQSRWIGASLDNVFLRIPVLKYLVPWILVLIFPVAILLLSIKRSYRNKNFRTLVPWMIIFMAVRYFGTISGIFRKVYLKDNRR